jgi:hypothetical protein
MLKWLVLLAIVMIGYRVLRSTMERRQLQAQRAQQVETRLAQVKHSADEDITVFGEELQRLDLEVTGSTLDEATRADYQRALDAYDAAKSSIEQVSTPEDIRNVTSILEDGRYAVACVKARLAGAPLPQRRPPCFFNPQHGPSTTQVSWAPPGGIPREVPACAADAERVLAGAEPDSRQVMIGSRRVPYWQGGPAYQPMMAGYFGGFAGSGLLPGFLVGMVTADLLTPDYSSQMADPFDTGDTGGYDQDGGYGDGGGYDGGGYDGGGGGDGGYGDGGYGGDGGGGGDSGGIFDSGAGWGGGDGGGFDGGGFDGGGFDGGGGGD